MPNATPSQIRPQASEKASQKARPATCRRGHR